MTSEEREMLLEMPAVLELLAEQREAFARLAYPKVRPPTISQEAFDIGVNLAAAIRARKETP